MLCLHQRNGVFYQKLNPQLLSLLPVARKKQGIAFIFPSPFLTPIHLTFRSPLTGAPSSSQDGGSRAELKRSPRAMGRAREAPVGLDTCRLWTILLLAAKFSCYRYFHPSQCLGFIDLNIPAVLLVIVPYKIFPFLKAFVGPTNILNILFGLSVRMHQY